MRSLIHAHGTDALKNGTFIHQRIGKHKSTYAQYINGDFMGWKQNPVVPASMSTYTLREARKHLPKNI